MNTKLLLPLLLGISLNTHALNIEASLNTTAKINMPSFGTAIHYAAICTSIFISICFIDSLFNPATPTQNIENNILVCIITPEDTLPELTKDVLNTKELSDMISTDYINVQQDGE